MSDGNASQSAATECIDHLFARLGGNAEAVPPPPPPAPEGVAAGASPPPVIRRSSDLAAASEWLQRERTRLEGYTRSQLERLHKEHQALISQNYHNEQALIEKIQELGRKEEFLTRQHRELQLQLQARLQAADKAETAARRRQAELDEVEARLTQEIEGQRRQMVEQRAALDERAAELAERGAHLDELEIVLGSVEEELSLRAQELDTRERNLLRREIAVSAAAMASKQPRRFSPPRRASAQIPGDAPGLDAAGQ